MKKKELIRILKESDKLNEELQAEIANFRSQKTTTGNVTTTEDVKPKPKDIVVICSIKEKKMFLISMTSDNRPDILDTKCNYILLFGDEWRQGDSSEYDQSSIITFQDYITRESLTEKWHDFLIAEAVKRGFKEGVKYESVNEARGDYTATAIPKYWVNSEFTGDALYCGLYCGLIYNNGKWATIIEDTKEQPKQETFTKSDMLNFAKYANPEYCAGQWIGLDELLDYFIKNKGK
jgi:hypothetical protein